MNAKHAANETAAVRRDESKQQALMISGMIN
jgi:hypothetical protein